MSKTVILLFHPDLARSRANAALAAAAELLPGVEVVHMQALYPSGMIDDKAEVARLLSADRVVLQFPIHWYSTPPLLQAWQDAVLSRMFYVHPGAEGARVEGLPFMVAATAGNRPEAYSPWGANLFPLEELLKPLRATANRCRFSWVEPFLLYEANKVDDEALREAGERYAERLRRWIAGPVPATHRPAAPLANAVAG